MPQTETSAPGAQAGRAPGKCSSAAGVGWGPGQERGAPLQASRRQQLKDTPRGHDLSLHGPEGTPALACYSPNTSRHSCRQAPQGRRHQQVGRPERRAGCPSPRPLTGEPLAGRGPWAPPRPSPAHHGPGPRDTLLRDLQGPGGTSRLPEVPSPNPQLGAATPTGSVWKHITTLPTSVSTSRPGETAEQLPPTPSGARTCESVCARRAPRGWRAALPHCSTACRDEAACSLPGPLRISRVEVRGVPHQPPENDHHMALQSQQPRALGPCVQSQAGEGSGGRAASGGLNTRPRPAAPPSSTSAGTRHHPPHPGSPPCLQGQHAVARAPPTSLLPKDKGPAEELRVGVLLLSSLFPTCHSPTP